MGNSSDSENSPLSSWHKTWSHTVSKLVAKGPWKTQLLGEERSVNFLTTTKTHQALLHMSWTFLVHRRWAQLRFRGGQTVECLHAFLLRSLHQQRLSLSAGGRTWAFSSVMDFCLSADQRHVSYGRSSWVVWYDVLYSFSVTYTGAN